jgi:hypothetical protein
MGTDVQRNLSSLSSGEGKQTFVLYISYSEYFERMSWFNVSVFRLRIRVQEPQRKAERTGVKWTPKLLFHADDGILLGRTIKTTLIRRLVQK